MSRSKEKIKTTRKKLEKPLKLNMSFDEVMKRIVKVKAQKKK